MQKSVISLFNVSANDPAREYDGEDDQLNKAIEVILEQLDQYQPLPPVPADPDKTR